MRSCFKLFENSHVKAHEVWMWKSNSQFSLSCSVQSSSLMRTSNFMAGWEKKTFLPIWNCPCYPMILIGFNWRIQQVSLLLFYDWCCCCCGCSGRCKVSCRLGCPGGILCEMKPPSPSFPKYSSLRVIYSNTDEKKTSTYLKNWCLQRSRFLS